MAEDTTSVGDPTHIRGRQTVAAAKVMHKMSRGCSSAMCNSVARSSSQHKVVCANALPIDPRVMLVFVCFWGVEGGTTSITEQSLE